jgi:hypothetical protein
MRKPERQADAARKPAIRRRVRLPLDPTTTGRTMKSGPSGSGSSTSGGRDDNADQGRDKMPDSDKNVRPNNKPDKH